MDETIGLRLIEDLKTDSEKFYDEGKSYLLLQEYYNGFPKDTLRPLLKLEDKGLNALPSGQRLNLG